VICEGEVLQIIGRGRGVNRTAANPLDVWVLTDVVLPIPVEPIRNADLAPSVDDLMLAEGGIAFSNSADAARAYCPAIWPTAKAAKHAFDREVSPKPVYKAYYTGMGLTSPWTYLRGGAGMRPATALVDEVRLADPAAAIAAKIGRLSLVERVASRRVSPIERATTPGEALNAILGTGLLGRERPKSPWEAYCATHVAA
jgi:putative DNA primase/helicase